MLQFLVCSDIHTYADNIRLAIRKTDHIDAILIAGDLELEQETVLAAVGSIPCYMVSGNNDYYLNTDYPEELIIDICQRADTPSANLAPSTESSPSADLTPSTASTPSADLTPSIGSKGPMLGAVTELHYDSLPDTGIEQAAPDRGLLSSIVSGLSFLNPFSSDLFSSKKNEQLPAGLSFPPHTFKRPSNIIHRILMTHGKEYKVPDITLLTRRAGIWDADLVIFGHTHQFWDTVSRREKVRLINPGCLVGDPRDSIRTYGNYEICSFALLRFCDHGEIEVEHLYL